MPNAARSRRPYGIGAVAIYWCCVFKSRDAFIAFIGMDVRVRDSGKFRGQRKLTKKGDSEIRRLLYCAAMAAARTALFKPQYRLLRARGLSSTASYVVIARKLARLAFALLRRQAQFDVNEAPVRLHGNIESPAIAPCRPSMAVSVTAISLRLDFQKLPNQRNREPALGDQRGMIETL